MLRAIPVFLALGIIAGCASVSGFPDRSEAVDTRLEALGKLYFLPEKDVQTEYAVKTGSAKREYRDQVVYGRMQAVDLQFSAFQEAIYREGISSNLTLDLLGIGVGGAGAIVTGTDASQIFSALSAGISGSRTSINKNLYFERTMPALLALMESERDRLRAVILEGLTQDTARYPLGRALFDLESYYRVGSIPGAISSITQVAGAVQAEADAALKEVREKSFVDPPAQQRVSDLLDLVEKLPAGAAVKVLQAPPSPLSNFVSSAISARLAGQTLALSAPALSDTQAKELLKMIVVLMKNRSEPNTNKWASTIQALGGQ